MVVGVATLEEQVSRVWNPDVRSLVKEAYASYNSGVARACIILTWVAVCADIIAKARRLADEGDGDARENVLLVDKAHEAGLKGGAAKMMSDVEGGILETARKLDLIDSIAERELERLREDRHICAHPSLRTIDEIYEPKIEYARAHFVTALDVLLVHPPRQGQRAELSFRTHVADESFTGDAEYIAKAFFQDVRERTKRKIVEFAVKHAYKEPEESPKPPGPVVVADRMASCIETFALHDRPLVRAAMEKFHDSLSYIASDNFVRVVSRFSNLDVFWETLQTADKSRIKALVEQMETKAYEEYSDSDRRLLSLASSPFSRSDIPEVKEAFDAADVLIRAELIERRPSIFLAQHLPRLVHDAYSFYVARKVVTSAVVPCAKHMDSVQLLKEVLMSWALNRQCRTSMTLPEEAVVLFTGTTHLYPESSHVWEEFLSKVREYDDDTNYYDYFELESVLRSMRGGVENG